MGKYSCSMEHCGLVYWRVNLLFLFISGTLQQGLGLMSRYVSHHPTSKGRSYFQQIWLFWWCVSQIPKFRDINPKPCTFGHQKWLANPGHGGLVRKSSSSFAIPFSSDTLRESSNVALANPPSLMISPWNPLKFFTSTIWFVYLPIFFHDFPHGFSYMMFPYVLRFLLSIPLNFDPGTVSAGSSEALHRITLAVFKTLAGWWLVGGLYYPVYWGSESSKLPGNPGLFTNNMIGLFWSH